MPPNREHPDWQGIWERLRKLGFEFDHDRRNGIVEAFERLYNFAPIGWRSLFERYVEGDTEVHIHIRTRACIWPDIFEAPNLCATFKWPRGVLLNDSEYKFWLGGAANDSPNIVEYDADESEMRVAMLVDVPEFIENRKRLFGRIFPAAKRLQLLDDCAKVWSDSPEAVRWLNSPGDTSARDRVSRAGVERIDRESDLPPLVVRVSPSVWNYGRGRVSVGDGELPNEVVERGAEIVDDISNDRSPLFDSGHRFTVDEYLGCLPVVLGFDFVRIQILGERLDPFTKEVQVHIRPTYLGPTSTEVGLVGHDQGAS
jgi:hypothetical protein